MTITRIISKAVREPRHVLGRVLWHTGLCRLFTIKTELYRLHFFPTPTSCAMWVNADCYHDDHDFLRRMLRSGDTVVDVGANVGTLALASAALVGPTGSVIAIEAHPRTFGYLQKNLKLNAASNVQAIHSAVGESDGVLRFTDKTLDDQNSVTDGAEGIEVPVRRLDDLVSVGRIDLLKVDVEGFELFVFRGAPQVLARTSCIYFECFQSHCDQFKYSPADIMNLLTAAGFTIYHVGENGLRPFTGDAAQLQNLVAFQNDAAGAERRRKFDVV